MCARAIDTGGGAGGRLIASGVTASAMRAVGTSAVTIFLPLLLIRVLQAETYASWAVVFAAAALVSYLDFGMPAAVQVIASRRIVESQGNGLAVRRVAWAGIALTVGVTVIAAVSMGVLAANLGNVYPDIAHDRLDDARLALCVLAVAQSGTVVSNVAAGYFVGLQQNWLATAILLPARFGSAVACGAVALAADSLRLLALAFACPILIGLAALVVQTARSLPGEGDRDSSPSVIATSRELMRFAAPLALFSVAGALISGLDIVIVGRVDYHSLAPYSVAAVASIGVVGLVNAMLAPGLPVMARLYATGKSTTLASQVLTWGQFSGAVAVVGYVALISCLSAITAYRDSVPFLALLALGMSVRLAATPLAFGGIAAGKARRQVGSTIVEALLNLALSVGLGSILGGIGVALATAISAWVGMLLLTAHAVRHIDGLHEIRAEYFVSVLIRNLCCALPFSIALAMSLCYGSGAASAILLTGAVVTLSATFISSRTILSLMIRTMRAAARDLRSDFISALRKKMRSRSVNDDRLI